ncbi:MAG: SAF domain-containing protein [Spirochaetia bacterium]|jgi:predicted homoserine dehydrogenase-like protein|nr:SAF domain-containing protein [Spirochaetia bacterium]
MIYRQVFKKYRRKEKVTAAVIGPGQYGKAIVTQHPFVEGLHVPVVADTDIEAAKSSILKAGIPESKILYSKDAGETRKAIFDGKYVYTDDPMIVMDIPEIDVIVEATGVPEAGARYCSAAIERKKSIAAVSKEMDSAIGPILRRRAIENGVRYSPVDGDQPGLIIGLVEWGRMIGLSIISAGKARDAEWILDEKKRTLFVQSDGITVHKDQTESISERYIKYFKKIPNESDAAQEYIDNRLEAGKSMPIIGDYDYCEMTIAANALGLKPDIPQTSLAPLRITELPIVFCSKKNGGIYNNEGTIDCHTNLRCLDESGMGGGVYMIVRCDNEYSRYIVNTKGHIINYDGSAAVIYRPYHLCGVETCVTILCIGLLNVDTGALDYFPSVDLVKIATRDIKRGEELGNDHDKRMTAIMVPATKWGPDNAMPAHLITGNKTTVDIKKGQTITYSMIEEPTNSVLWELRAQQEKIFA